MPAFVYCSVFKFQRAWKFNNKVKKWRAKVDEKQAEEIGCEGGNQENKDYMTK